MRPQARATALFNRHFYIHFIAKFIVVFMAVLIGLQSAAHADPPSLTLPEAVAIARRHHPTVEAQRGQARAADGRAWQAAAPLFPYLSGSAGYEPQTPNYVVTPSIDRAITAITGTTTVSDRAGQPVTVTCRDPGIGSCAPVTIPPASWALQNFWTMNIGINWTLWDWGKSIRGWQGARAQTAAARVGVTTAERDVALNVKLAFFGVIAADEQLDVANEAVKVYQVHVEQTRAFHDTGLRTGIDVATAESTYASVAVTRARALAAQAAARAALMAALGDQRWQDWQLIADPSTFDWSARDDARLAGGSDAYVGTAFSQRTELKQLALQERGFRLQAQSARGQYLPQLTLSLGPSLAGIDSALSPNFSVLIAVGYPLSGMSPILIHGQVREAEGNLVATEAQARAAHDAIRQETIDARAALSSAREELMSARAFREAATRQRQLAEGRYQTGVGNIIELNDALLNYINARYQWVRARLDLATARARLSHALGEDD